MSKQKMIPFMIVLILIFIANPVYANNDVQVYVDHTLVQMESTPIIKKGRLLVPVRPIAIALNASIDWDSKQHEVTIRKENTAIKLRTGSRTAKVNQKDVLLETSPIISNNRVLVPLRFIGEIFGASVAWDGQSRTVSILQPQTLLNHDVSEIYSVVRQLDTENNPLDEERINSTFTQEYIENEIGSDEDLHEFVHQSTTSAEKIGIIETILYDLQDTLAKVYISYKISDESSAHYFIGFVHLKKVNDHWLIDDISDYELHDLNEQILINAYKEPLRDNQIDDSVRNAVLSTMNQYIEAVEEHNWDKLNETLAENLKEADPEAKEAFESEEKDDSSTVEDYIIEVLQTNGDLAYIKMTFHSIELEDLGYLYMLKKTDSGWKIFDFQMIFLP